MQQAINSSWCEPVAAAGTGAASVVVATASAAATEVVLVEAMVSIAVISEASVLSAATTMTQGAGGAHAITDESATDDCSAAPQRRSRLGRGTQSRKRVQHHLAPYQAHVRKSEKS
jgi:hypothetical protein